MMQLQRLVIQDPLRFGISGKENLESPIKEEPFHPVRPHPPPIPSDASRRRKGTPLSLSFRAQHKPASPPPTTITSAFPSTRSSLLNKLFYQSFYRSAGLISSPAPKSFCRAMKTARSFFCRSLPRFIREFMGMAMRGFFLRSFSCRARKANRDG